MPTRKSKSGEEARQSRLDFWKGKHLLTLTIGGHEGDRLTDAWNTRLQEPLRQRTLPSFNTLSLVEASRELIFDIEDGKPVVHYVSFVVD